MFKHVSALVTALVLLCSLGTTAQAAERVFKVGLGDALEADAGAYALKFKELVEKRTNGKVSIDIFPQCALGGEAEMLQNVRRGTLDMCVVGIGNAVPLVPILGAYTFPYLLHNEEAVVKATTGDLFDYFNTRVTKEGGFRILGHAYTNFRHITNSVREVKNLEDLAGLKLRMPNNKVFLATYRAWGANPVPMDWSETFTALQQGVVDGQDNPYIVNHTSKFQEVQKYLTEIHYQYSLQPMFIGEKTFKKLDPELQKIFVDAGMEAQLYLVQWQKDNAGKAKEAMIADGLKVTTLSPEEEARWKEIAITKVWPEMYDAVGGKELIERIQKVIAE